MLSIATLALLATTHFIDASDSNVFVPSDSSEMEMVFEEGLETDLQGDEIVFDDSLLIDPELQELEE